MKAGPIEVKDMLLKDAIEEKQAKDLKAVEAFGGHPESAHL